MTKVPTQSTDHKRYPIGTMSKEEFSRQVSRITAEPLNLKVLAFDRGRYWKDGKWVDFVGPCELELEVVP